MQPRSPFWHDDYCPALIESRKLLFEWTPANYNVQSSIKVLQRVLKAHGGCWVKASSVEIMSCIQRLDVDGGADGGRMQKRPNTMLMCQYYHESFAVQTGRPFQAWLCNNLITHHWMLHLAGSIMTSTERDGIPWSELFHCFVSFCFLEMRTITRTLARTTSCALSSNEVKLEVIGNEALVWRMKKD